jgi:integrase/recombinase XerD
MTLKKAVTDYVGFRQTLGERCKTNGRLLQSFCRTMGENTPLEQVSPESVRVFLAGTGPLTASWHVKHNTLLGFYRYATSRGLVTESPLPQVIPKRPPAFQPYIYSQEELRRLLEASASYQRHRGLLDPRMVRALLLLLYGAALRVSEALALTYADVDLDKAVLTVRDSKFFKSRLVPLGPNLTQEMREYADGRNANGEFPESEATFFAGRNGQPVNLNTLENAFQRLRAHAGLWRDGGPRCQPRLHDLRHTSAVHRLTWCYRQGGDVQKFLAQLSVYMGHTYLAATQVYLSMTPELLQEASLRFERYAIQEDEHD